MLQYYIANGQNNGFVNYSIADGLPSSQNYDIFQDKKGAIWFCTDNGLSVFDGFEFKNYEIEDGITDNTVFNFFPQNDGKIWCTTLNKKLFSIHSRKNLFTPYPYNNVIEKLGLSELKVPTFFYLAPDSSVYLSFVNSAGYLRISKEGKVICNSVTNEYMETQTVLCVDRAGGYFFYKWKAEKVNIPGFKKIYYSNEQIGYDQFIKACYHKSLSVAAFISPQRITFILKDGTSKIIETSNQPVAAGIYDDQHFWIGFRFGGFALYDHQGTKVGHYLSKHSVNKVFTDHESGIWVSTLDAGVFHRNKSEVKTIVLPEEDTWVNNLVEDEKHRIWIACYNGNLNCYEGDSVRRIFTSGNFKPSLLSYNKKNKSLWFYSDNTITEIKKQRAYTTVTGGIRMLFINDSLAICLVRNLQFLKNGVSTSLLLLNKRVNDVCIHNQKLFLATNEGVYFHENGETQPWPNLKAALRINEIESWNNKLVIATRGKGLYIHNGKKLIQLTKQNGLCSNSILRIIVENKNTMWLCTNAGINKVSIQDGKFIIKSITIKNGLISNEVTDLLISENTVWVGSKMGLCTFPKNIAETRSKPIHYFLSVKNVLVNDTLPINKDDFHLNYLQNRVEFNVHAYSFKENNPLVYRYKLEGLDRKWNYTTSRKILYSSLAPGNYKFIVQVKGENDQWKSSEVSRSFHISPPYWKTMWFRLSLTGFILLLIYLFFRYNILSYNRDIVRELLRQLLKKVSGKKKYVVFREQGKEIKIPTSSIYYVKAEGNYIEIITDHKKHVVRYKIGEFLGTVSDPLEFLRVNRSYIVRIDKVEAKGKAELTVKGEKIPVGETYIDQLQKIQF